MEFRAILRIANAEVKGETPIAYAIAKAKGAKFMFANAVCKVLNLDKTKRAGDFSEKELLLAFWFHETHGKSWSDERGWE